MAMYRGETGFKCQEFLQDLKVRILPETFFSQVYVHVSKPSLRIPQRIFVWRSFVFPLKFILKCNLC